MVCEVEKSEVGNSALARLGREKGQLHQNDFLLDHPVIGVTPYLQRELPFWSLQPLTKLVVLVGVVRASYSDLRQSVALVEDGEVFGSRQLDMGNSGLVGFTSR